MRQAVLSKPAVQAGLLLLAAFAVRTWFFGNPVIHSDEQFYLLVGDRIWAGAWPYVDIFDRKPVGLFLLFAAIRSLGGDGVVQYQVTATVFAAATAFLVTRIASRFATESQAFGAGLIYLVWLLIYDGAGGQSPVWGNAPMAGAALLVLDGVRGRGALVWRGIAAMLLAGLAMQIKYTAVFEGVFLGIALLWSGWRKKLLLPRLAMLAVLWVGAALLPTAAAWAAYVAAGHGEVFVFANFVSGFGQRDDDGFLSDLVKAAGGLALAAPLLWLAWSGRARNGFALVWTAVAVGAILLMGTLELFYFLPLALPLAVAAAAGLTRRRLAATLLFGGAAASVLAVIRIDRRGTAAETAALVRLIGDSPPGCLFSFGSEPVLYHLTRSCLLTPYLFRSHLAKLGEAQATGVDQAAEVARVLALRPGVIVVREPTRQTTPAAHALVVRAVAERYRLVGTVRLGDLRHRVYRLTPRGTGR